MPALLELSRNRDEVIRQLLRRIGYTEGLFRIVRHAHVLAAISPSLPASVPLADARIREAMTRTQEAGEPSNRKSGRAYGEGVRNVLVALRLLRRTGAKIALAPRGRALVAIHNAAGPASPELKALLVAAIIDADGDYTLNLIAEGSPRFPDNIEEVLRRKELWFQSASYGPTKAFALAQISRIRTTLFGPPIGGKGVSGFNENTLRHTVTPRQGWIRELGLAPMFVRQRMLAVLREHSQCFKGPDGQDVVVLGFSDDLTIALGLDLPILDRDLVWRMAALAQSPDPREAELNPELVAALYPDLRLRSFNQVELEAVFDVYAAYSAARGLAATQSSFLTGIDALTSTGTGYWRMASRRGGPLQGYLAFKPIDQKRGLS